MFAFICFYIECVSGLHHIVRTRPKWDWKKAVSHSLVENQNTFFFYLFVQVSLCLSLSINSLLSAFIPSSVHVQAHTHTQTRTHTHKKLLSPAGEVRGERVSGPLGSEWFGDSVIQLQLAAHNNMKLARSILSGDVSAKPCRDPISTQRNFGTTFQRLFVCPFMQREKK